MLAPKCRVGDLGAAPTRHLGANKGYASKTIYFIIQNIPCLVHENVGLVPYTTYIQKYTHIRSIYCTIVQHETRNRHGNLKTWNNF